MTTPTAPPADATPPDWVVLGLRGPSLLTAAPWRVVQAVVAAHRRAGQRVALALTHPQPMGPLIDAALSGAPGDGLDDALAAHAALADALQVPAEALAAGTDEIKRLLDGVRLTGEATPRLTARLGLAWADLLAAIVAPGLGAQVHGPDAPAGDSPVGLWPAAYAAGPTHRGPGAGDLGAADLAVRLGARQCALWSDTPGLFTADPTQEPAAQRIPRLDPDEAQELATAGAPGLHPRCVRPLAQAGIPLVLHGYGAPEAAGTTIEPSAAAAPALKAIACRRDVALISMDTLGMWQQVGFLAQVFQIFAGHAVSIDLISTSEANVTVSFAPEGVAVGPLLEALAPHCRARLIADVAAVSLVGRGIRAILHRLGPALKAFEEHRVHLVSQAASDVNLTVVVDAHQADRLVRDLHARFFTTPSAVALASPAATGPAPWWRTRRDDLLRVAAQGTPAYVYEQATIEARARALKGLTALDRRLYAIKANDHPQILGALRAQGYGFECVSLGEVQHVRSLFPRLDPQRVLFTPNFAPMDEYAAGLAAGVNVTLDSLYPLQAWPELFQGQRVFLRLDPGQGRGHHVHVRTAGARSKFGIVPERLDEAVALTRAAGCTVVGLHAHAGSGIRTPDGWAQTARFLAAAAAHFPDVQILDLGGGLGIVERPGQTPLDLAAVGAQLSAFKAEHPHLSLWMEPGRFLVAEAGVLLARVTQVKTKGERRYVGVDAGMHTLIRPALYGAWHAIANLSRLDAPPVAPVDIVGPICETGDTLGRDRWLPETHEGDVLLIATAGAYGRVMSSGYNRRPFPREVLL